MGFSVETLGNASVQICRDDVPLLATDPWLLGTAYFGSWALDLPLTKEQIDRVARSEYIWISHGHPDHLHRESLDLLPRRKKILVPDHYSNEIHDSLVAQGFSVSRMPYRQWVRLGDGCEAMCIDNWNQDGILIIRAGDALLVNLNDSPLLGEGAFIRSLVKRHRNRKTYLFALCATNVDMFNFIDEHDRSLVGHPEERKRGTIWAAARLADRLGVANFCTSSSQHLYVRADSCWANPYRITAADLERHWSRPRVRLHEPYVTIDLGSGEVTRNHPSQKTDLDRVTGSTGDDDWSVPLSEAEWAEAERFFRRFEMLRGRFDVIGLTVGGETRWFHFSAAKPDIELRSLKGFRFKVPRASLLQACRCGYFDDLLIGNFMQTELINASLYPHFSPIVSKLGGNAKVFTRSEWRRFWWRYIRRNPAAFARDQAGVFVDRVINKVRNASDAIGVKGPLKRIYRRYLGDPI